MSAGRGVARAAILLATLTAVSQVFGFARDAVIAAVYGASSALDAYLVAQGLMNLVLALAAGAISRALVPVVSRAVAAGDQQRANRVVQVVLTLTMLVLMSGAVVMYFAAELVVMVLAPGFDESTRTLAVELARIVLVATVFVAATDVLAAATQANGRFFASGIQGLPFNVVMIAAAAFFGPTFGAHALAVGFVVGSAVRMLIQLIPLPKFSLRLRPRLDLHDPGVLEVLRLVPALLITTAAVNVNTLVDRAVGSAQGEGVVAALNFGWRIVTLVDSLLVVTLVAAIYPAFGAAGAPERRGQLRALVSRAMRVVVILITPVVGLMMLTATPIVNVLFGRGAFTDEAVMLAATAVSAYAVSAVAIALRTLGSRACLAVGDARTPVVVSLVVMAVNVTGDLTLGVRFGVAGLAASTSLSLLAGAAAVLLRLHGRHQGVELGPLMGTAFRAVLATAAAVGVCGVLGLPSWLRDASTSGQIGGLALTFLLGAVVYVAVIVGLRGGEFVELRSVLRRRRRPGIEDE